MHSENEWAESWKPGSAWSRSRLTSEHVDVEASQRIAYCQEKCDRFTRRTDFTKHAEMCKSWLLETVMQRWCAKDCVNISTTKTVALNVHLAENHWQHLASNCVMTPWKSTASFSNELRLCLITLHLLILPVCCEKRRELPLRDEQNRKKLILRLLFTMQKLPIASNDLVCLSGPFCL